MTSDSRSAANWTAWSSLTLTLVIARILLALAVIVVAGFWGFVTLFTDVSESRGYFGWIIYLLGGHALAGFIVGILLPRRWKLGITASWGAMTFGLGGLVGAIASDAPATPDVPLVYQLAASVLALIAIPIITLLSALQGSRILTRKQQATPSEEKNS